MPTVRWPEPERSIGFQLEKPSRFGRCKRWELRDNSPAFELWKRIQKDLKILLHDRYDFLDSSGSSWYLGMYMIGSKPENARPTILFSCERRATRKRAVELIQQEISSLSLHQEVAIKEWPKLPHLLSLELEADFDPLEPGVYINGSISPYGISVLVYGSNGPPRKSTIGGFVVVDHKIYGVTTAHSFLASSRAELGNMEHNFESDQQGGNSERSSSDEEYHMIRKDNTSNSIYQSMTADLRSSPILKPENTSWSAGFDSSKCYEGLRRGHRVFATSMGEKYVGCHNILATSNAAGCHTKMASDHTKISSTDSAPKGRPEKLGHWHAGKNLLFDWALVDIDHSDLHSANEIYKQTMTESEKKGSVTCDAQVYNAAINLATAFGDTALGVHVLVYTGSDQGPLKGMLSLGSSFRKVPSTMEVQECWTVTLDDVDCFDDGNSGSWVVDAKTFDLYGHIVSGFPGTCLAYVIPATQVIKDIERTLQMPVTQLIKTCPSQSSRSQNTSHIDLLCAAFPKLDQPDHVNTENHRQVLKGSTCGRREESCTTQGNKDKESSEQKRSRRVPLGNPLISTPIQGGTEAVSQTVGIFLDVAKDAIHQKPCVNLAKLYTVEHNLKVMGVGNVEDPDLPRLQSMTPMQITSLSPQIPAERGQNTLLENRDSMNGQPEGRGTSIPATGYQSPRIFSALGGNNVVIQAPYDLSEKIYLESNFGTNNNTPPLGPGNCRPTFDMNLRAKNNFDYAPSGNQYAVPMPYPSLEQSLGASFGPYCNTAQLDPNNVPSSERSYWARTPYDSTH